MANEAEIRHFIRVSKDNLEWQSPNTSFQADIATGKGPIPGAITVTVAGTNLDFSQFSTPGFVRVANLDSTNYVEIGIYALTVFYPVIELLAGESYVFRWTRDAKSLASSAVIQARADTAQLFLSVEGFEK